MDYDKTFETRLHKYKYAIETYPHALDSEFKTAIDMCDLKPGMVLVNVLAAGVPLYKYISPDIVYVPLECNEVFASLADVWYSPLNELRLSDNSVDVIVSLASLHHVNDSEREVFYKECVRVLRPGGRLVIGDVMRGSKQDVWLNTFVNTHNSAGHNGQFWSAADAQLLEDTGFNVSIQTAKYTWEFESDTAMIDFCKHLFGLDCATDTQIAHGLIHYLGAHEHCIPWELMYFMATFTPKGDLTQAPSPLDIDVCLPKE